MRPISFFVPNLSVGGAQKVVVNLVNGLSLITNHPIHLITLRREGEFLSHINPKVSIYSLNKNRVLTCCFALSFYIFKNKPLILCSSLFYSNLCVVVSWMISFCSCRLILREDCLFDNTMSHCSLFKGKLIRFLMKLLYRYAHSVVAISNPVKNSLIENKICKTNLITVIPNPVDINFFNNFVKKYKLNLPEYENYICAVGRLSFEKGFDILLKAFSEIDNTDIHLVIIGDGKLKKELLDYANEFSISDKVHFTGFINPYEILQNSSLFVLPSRSEGFGLALVEALALGVPVVATSCPGAPREILLNGKLGHLVETENASALTSAINNALINPRSNSIDRKLRAQEYSTPVICKRYLSEVFNI